MLLQVIGERLLLYLSTYLKSLDSKKFPPFFEFLLYEMFFGLPLDFNLKSQKFKKLRTGT